MPKHTLFFCGGLTLSDRNASACARVGLEPTLRDGAVPAFPWSCFRSVCLDYLLWGLRQVTGLIGAMLRAR